MEIKSDAVQNKPTLSTEQTFSDGQRVSAKTGRINHELLDVS
jgi:hypothetical protein